MNKRQKRLISGMCIFLAVLMVLSLILSILPALAVSESDIAEIRARRAQLQDQLTSQAAVVEKLAAGQSLIIDRKAALDRQIELNREDVSLLEEEIRAYDELIWVKGLELENASQAQQDQTAQLRERMRVMEERGEDTYLSMIFEAENIPDLLSRMADVADVMHYDKELELLLQSTKEQVEKLKGEYEQIRLEQEDIRRELSSREELLNAQVASAQEVIAELDAMGESAIKEYQAIEAAEKQAMEQEQRALAQLAAEREAARLAALAQAQAQAAQAAAAAGAANGAPAAAASGNFAGTYAATYGNAGAASLGSFIWPTNSTYITSNYGGRTSPTAGASSYHEAIDIGAVAGSPIYAVADGQVAVATYNNGLGNYVSIAHDGGVATRYSHMTNFVVQPGQYVTQGQIIGYVGSTGIATGDHLDFAVTQNGTSVNPLSFYNTGVLTYDPTA